VYVSLLTTLRLPLGKMPYLLKSLAEGLHVCQRIKVGDMCLSAIKVGDAFRKVIVFSNTR